ncbi:hypothetical protein ACFCX4_18605 [Kitasatospora sp. NPDC056327]|uniref:hypothetical protein n=1 Tax=Kitasatospora sp. NPDC056327 TaxID=3345785 RepID=UPI0035D70F7C
MTGAGPDPAAVDERVLGAGTNARFALLLVLLVAASGSMLMPVLTAFRSGSLTGCLLAAGADVDRLGTLGSTLRTTGQSLAYLPCAARDNPPLPWWQIVCGPAAVLLFAAAIAAVLPRWKQRRGRCVELALVDRTGVVEARVRALAAGRVDPVPALFQASAVLTRNGAAFGRNRRPRLRLNAGLVACRDTDAATFDAVVLHELAHVANRDLTVTYATVALWRSFLTLVLCPYVLVTFWRGTRLVARGDTLFSADYARQVALPVLTVLVISVVRAEVLRSRELHADLTARRWRAPLEHVWAAMPPRRAVRGVRRWADGALELVRIHPPWEVRRDALADPAPLFEVRALLMFLIGVIAALTNYHLMWHFVPHMAMMNGWLNQAVGAAPAAVVAAATAPLLWRAVLRTTALGRRPPTGVRGGLWLGAGLVAGSVLNGHTTGSLWLPARWGALGLVVVAAVGFTCWTTQCARLAATVRPGRSLRFPLALGLVAGWLVLSVWFTWWDYYGAMYVHGAWYDGAGARQAVVQWFPGTGTVRPDTSALMARVVPPLRYVVGVPLVPLAAVTSWVVPLALWAVGSRRGGPGTAAVPLLPSLRRALGAALGGGAFAVVCVAAVQAWLHHLHAGVGQRGGLYAFSYALWCLAAIVLGAAVAASAAARVPAFRLPAALVASGTAALLGIGGMVLLISADGCLGSLSVLNDTCGWRPAWRQLQGGLTFRLVIHAALLVAPVTALLVTALAALARRTADSRTARRPRPSPAVGPPAGRQRVLPTLGLGTCVVALATAVILLVADVPGQLRPVAKTVSPAAQAEFQRIMGLPILPVSARMRWRQVHAWYRVGGRYLVENAMADGAALVKVLGEARHDERIDITPALMTKVRPFCVDLRNIAGWEVYYFQVPDPAAQAAWHRFGVTALVAGGRCAEAANRSDTGAFASSVTDLLKAVRDVRDMSGRIRQILDDPQDRVFTGRPLPPPQPRL